MTIDPTKTYRTRDGREVRIYAVDAGAPYPVQGAIWHDGRWEVAIWTACGRSLFNLDRETESDLIEAKPRIQGWVNVYPNMGIGCNYYASKQEADNIAAHSRIACVRIDVEEGEGL